MKRSGLIPGTILILVGLYMFAHNLGLFTLEFFYIWPLFLIVPGLFFEFAFFLRGHNPSSLVPAGILLTYGTLFYVNIFTDWVHMHALWPFFIIGPGIGLLQLYIFGERERGILVPAIILLGLGLAFLSTTFFGLSHKLITPALLILIGLYVINKK